MFDTISALRQLTVESRRHVNIVVTNTMVKVSACGVSTRTMLTVTVAYKEKDSVTYSSFLIQTSPQADQRLDKGRLIFIDIFMFFFRTEVLHVKWLYLTDIGGENSAGQQCLVISQARLRFSQRWLDGSSPTLSSCCHSQALPATQL